MGANRTPTGDALLERLRRELRARRRTWLVLVGAAAVLVIVALPGVGMALLGEAELLLVGFGRTLWGRVAILLGAVVTWLVFRHALAESHVRKLAEGLTAANDVRLVRPLLEAWQAGAGPTRQACGRALEHLLPMLKATDDAVLEDAHRRIMRDALASADPYLAMAVLEALEQVGTEDDIGLVQDLAAGRAGRSGLPLAGDRRVAAAARAALPAVQASADAHRLRGVLLRPADAPRIDGEGELRPAAPANETPPEQLVRPAQADPEGGEQT